MVDQALNFLADKWGVGVDFLKFVGVQDESATIGKRLYHFNVMDPGHHKFRSTICYMETV